MTHLHLFFINQSQHFFVQEESPEVDLINGMQHAPPHRGLFPPCLKSKQGAVLVVCGSEQLHLRYSKQTSQVLILGEGFASFLTSGVRDPRQK